LGSAFSRPIAIVAKYVGYSWGNGYKENNHLCCVGNSNGNILGVCVRNVLLVRLLRLPQNKDKYTQDSTVPCGLNFQRRFFQLAVLPHKKSSATFFVG